MGKIRTLLQIAKILVKDPYALKRVLPNEVGNPNPSHDEIYDAKYFQFVEQTTAQSANAIADSMLRSFHPTSVVDVGCGTGVLLDRLRTQGVNVSGLEYAEAALKLCQLRELDVVKFDVERDELPAHIQHADIVVSMEVGQQLQPSSNDRYIDLLCKIADIAIFSSATPGQGDRRPRNEQTHQYWIEKFSQRNYAFDEALSLQWREEWNTQGTAPWFYRNVMIFRRK